MKQMFAVLFLLLVSIAGKCEKEQRINISGRLGFVAGKHRVLEVTYRKIGGYIWRICMALMARWQKIITLNRFRPIF